MNFTCEINSIKAHTIVGLYDFEKVKPQLLLFDIVYDYNLTRDVEYDELIDAPDYVAVSEELIAFIKSKSFNLLETLLSELIDYILHKFPIIINLKFTTTKPAAYPSAIGPKLFLEKENKR